MDVPVALVIQHLDGLAHADDADIIAATLTDLDHTLRRAVPSYGGMQLKAWRRGEELGLVLVPPGSRWHASLRFPLRSLSDGVEQGSRIIWYASAAGAFVDLAADLSHALHLPLVTDREPLPQGTDGSGTPGAVLVDADLPGPAVTELDGFAGLDRIATLERAIGVLIDRGHHPDDAYGVLRQGAGDAGVDVHEHATKMLDGLVRRDDDER